MTLMFLARLVHHLPAIKQKLIAANPSEAEKKREIGLEGDWSAPVMKVEVSPCTRQLRKLWNKTS
jgi:hypothetical protein